MRRQPAVICASLAVASLGLVVAVTSAADKRPESRSQPIELSDCRIKLIDRVTLASDRPGVIEFVAPQEGDHVKADDQIVGLKDDVVMARRAVAQREAENDIEIRYSKKAAEVAAAEYEKSLEVNEKIPNGVADIELQRLRLASEKSVLQIEQAENQRVIAQLKLAEADAELQTYQVIAPFDGVVTNVVKKKGEAVRQGDPILDLASTRKVRVEGDVQITDVWSIRRGDAVRVQLDIPDVNLEVEQHTFEGKVIFVDVTVNPLTREVRVWAEVENRDDILREGLSARMTIQPSGPSAQTAAK
jgi:RND family efflux transporter MFP subunit